MKVYLDIILLENIIMNYIILFATGIICKTEIKQIRIISSGILGSIYAVMSYITNFKFYSSIFVKILLSIAMVYFAFNSENLKTLFKEIIIFYLTSFLFGGCAFSLLYFVHPEKILFRDGKLVGTYPLKIAFLGAILGFIIINIAFKIIKKKINPRDMICDIEIIYNNKSCKIKSIIDTGNMLKDPITKDPVIIVEANELVSIIPKNVLDNIQKIIYGDYDKLNEKYISKFRVIPFTSIGKQNGLLLGIKVDKVIIKYDGKRIENKNIIVGIYDKVLSKNKEYSALVGLDLLEGEIKQNEYMANANR